MSDINRYPVVSDIEAGDKLLIVSGGQAKQATYSALLSVITENDPPQNLVYVSQASDLEGVLSPRSLYVVTRVIDMGTTQIEVPSGGLNLVGYTFNVSGLTSTENNYQMFTSPAGGSGSLVMFDMAITTSGVGSQVFDLTGETGNEALEFKAVNFNNCTSRGEITNFRQGLEEGCGYFGKTPELTLSGSWGGYRVTTTIVRNLDDITALFQEGTSLTFDGRFVTDMNCDLPTNGALFDFQESNFNKDESLVIDKAFITRDGVLNPNDTTIYPNIDQTSVKSNWSNNTGLPNTRKYIKANTTAEVTTTIAMANTYYPLEGTFTIEDNSHFDQPSNGELRLLTGTIDVNVFADLTIDGTNGDTIDIRVTKSTDDGATWPTVVNHVRRVINNLAGSDDVAFFSINFIENMNMDDRLRLEVENTTAARDVTMLNDSYWIVQGL